MSPAISQLLILRRRREQQAATQLQRKLASYREHEAKLDDLRRQEVELRRTVVQKVVSLYDETVDGRLSPADLDTLAAEVDRLYRLEDEMGARVDAATTELAAIGQQVVEARAVLLERTRSVQKLDQVLEAMLSEASRSAEIIAEDAAERPAGGTLQLQETASQ